MVKNTWPTWVAAPSATSSSRSTGPGTTNDASIQGSASGVAISGKYSTMTSGCTVRDSRRTVTYENDEHDTPQSAANTPVGSSTSPLGRAISATPAMPHAIATAVDQPIGSSSSHHASTPVSSGVAFCSTVASASGSRSSAM